MTEQRNGAPTLADMLNLISHLADAETERDEALARLAVVSMERDNARLGNEMDNQVIEDLEAERDHYERQGSDTLAEWDKMRVERDRLQAELDGRATDNVRASMLRQFATMVRTREATGMTEQEFAAKLLRMADATEPVPVEGDQT